MKFPHVSLDDKYTLEFGRVYLTGIQALVRLPMLQKRRDEAAGLNTAGYVSGYRGSPLGGLDQALWKAKKFLESRNIVFQPGVNEDLAASALWGTQQVNLYPGARYQGVFGLWYGKGPGVDRSADVLRHANAAGSSKYGGVLVVAGDDHGARSSTLPHQTEHLFKAVLMPVLAPAGVQEYLDFGLHGWAMSRYSGCWVAFKATGDTAESSASVYVDPLRLDINIPIDYDIPADGLNIRWPDPPLIQEERLLNQKLYAALAYARANKLNQIVIDSPKAKLGIITCGKSYLDVRQAFDDLGIDDALAAKIGIRLYKVGMVWPLEADGVRRFAEGLEEILVVEEKRQLLEYQLKEELYNWREDVRPRVIGKFDEKGEWALPHGQFLLPATFELSPAQIARAIASRIARFYTSETIQQRLKFLETKEQALAHPHASVQRIPYFCSGCPHNISTQVPEGSRAIAGIGCHYMAIWMDRHTSTFSSMGAEGVAWLGQAPFTNEKHVFANMGDGTYFHSGLLAIRAAVAAKAPITYKILYNDAVAMTGGQHIDGELSVPQMTRQLAAEGIKKIMVVTDEPAKYPRNANFAAGVTIHHRDELEVLQREVREYPDVSALIYDQTCAAEKRRRRKRGTYPDPARRIFINEMVCEGCGDCGVKSNCLSIEPIETEFGRKRAINQSSCNKDFSCANGFCPSFVTVEGGQLIKGKAAEIKSDDFSELPEPKLPELNSPYGILVTGVGGTGVVTIGALLGMAAHLEGKGVSALDMTGLAQKGGAVTSHIRIANTPEAIHAVRIAAGEADCVIGCDVIVAASADALSKMQSGRTRAVINIDETPTALFTHNPDWQFPLAEMQQDIMEAVGESSIDFVDATALATQLMGDAIATNMFMLGYAYQKGLVPVSDEAITRAIELNAVAVEANKKSFLWGRRAAHNLAAVRQAVVSAQVSSATRVLSRTLDEIIARRVQFLTAYQDAAYAKRYRDFVERVRAKEKNLNSEKLTEAVARNYFKLLSYKDEYEVARLYTEEFFMQSIKNSFEGNFKLKFHLAPPIFSKRHPVTGELQKNVYGPWMMLVFKLLAKLKFLRNTPFDIFRFSQERKLERDLIIAYEKTLMEMIHKLAEANLALAIEIASLPEVIRGFGSIKISNAQLAQKKQEELLVKFHATQPS